MTESLAIASRFPPRLSAIHSYTPPSDGSTCPIVSVVPLGFILNRELSTMAFPVAVTVDAISFTVICTSCTFLGRNKILQHEGNNKYKNEYILLVVKTIFRLRKNNVHRLCSILSSEEVRQSHRTRRKQNDLRQPSGPQVSW